MRLPLLVGARPKFMSEGPKVTLVKGCWAIVCERVNDSKLVVHVNGNGPTPIPVEIEGPCVVQVAIVHRGVEDYINIFAELR